MLVIVTGSSGLIGTALCAHLEREGHTVTRLVRRAPQSGEQRWDPERGELDRAVLEGADVVVNLAGAGIADHRWTAAYRATLMTSRVASTTLLATTIARCERPPTVFLSGSAIGYYGDRGDEIVDEQSPAGEGYLAEICRRWEDAAAAASSGSTRVAMLRTGIVLAPRGGALQKLLRIFKLGLGGRFGDGRQWQSWISLADEVRAITHLMTADVEGPVNLTSPNPVTNREFTRILADAVHRPAFIPVPRFGPRLLLGRDLADQLLFDSQRVRPSVLDASGFMFEHDRLDTALDALLDH
jgi:uncharacterized protein (TIGR01777 family)